MTVVFEFGSQKSGYMRTDAPIGESPLIAGVTYEIVFQAGTSVPPLGWAQNAMSDMRLKPHDSPLYGVVTEKCNLTYVRIDEESDNGNILSRTVTVQFDYLGAENQMGLARNIVRRLADWGDVYELAMVPPETMTVMSVDESSLVVPIVVGCALVMTALYIFTR
jgi:hypothetical protein